MDSGSLDPHKVALLKKVLFVIRTIIGNLASKFAETAVLDRKAGE